MVADPFHEGTRKLGRRASEQLLQNFSVGGEILVDEITVGAEILVTMVAVTVALIGDEGEKKREDDLFLEEAARTAHIVGNRATGSRVVSN